MTEEKRDNPRFSCDSQNTYTVDFPELEASGRLSNLSRSGMAFSVSRQLRENAVYQFNINVNDQRAIPCQARIAWVNLDPTTQRCVCGAKIVNMDPADKVDLIDAFYEEWKKGIAANP